MLWSKIERERVNMCSCAALVGTATGIIGECNGADIACIGERFPQILGFTLDLVFSSGGPLARGSAICLELGLLDRVAHFCLRSHEAKQSKVKLKVGESSIMDCAFNKVFNVEQV